MEALEIKCLIVQSPSPPPFLQYSSSDYVRTRSNLNGPPKDQACAFDVDTFKIRQSPCLRQSEYRWGFLDNKPCVILKLNKMFGWKPEKFIRYLDYNDDRKQEDACEFERKKGEPCDKIPEELMVRICAYKKNLACCCCCCCCFCFVFC